MRSGRAGRAGRVDHGPQTVKIEIESDGALID